MMLSSWGYDPAVATADVIAMVAEALRAPIKTPYWLRMQGHHGKNSTRWGRKPAKPYRRSAAVRKVYRGDQ